MASPTPLPFEYENRYADLYEEFGIAFDTAVVMEERDRQLEDFLAGLRSGAPVIDVGDGAVPTGHTKGYWIGTPGVLRRVTATLSVPGSTDTIANVLRNGSTIGAITIPANETVATAEVGGSFAADDFWQMQQTSAGTGAGGLTYFGDFG